MFRSERITSGRLSSWLASHSISRSPFFTWATISNRPESSKPSFIKNCSSSSFSTMMTLYFFMGRYIFFGFFVQGEIKGSAFTGFRLGPDAPAVAVYDLFADGQPYTGAGIVFLGIKPPKDLEYFMQVGLLNTDPVVRNRKLHMAILGTAADPDP